MNYASYNQAPGWGTQAHQLGQPPAPMYLPQPSWGGLDYYRAQYGGGTISNSPYNNAWSSLQGLGEIGRMGATSGTMGAGIGSLGKLQAKRCHRSIYTGLMDLRSAPPMYLAAAAAYEGWRTWKYHSATLMQPLGGDRIRQREALIGLAIGEAARLFNMVRPLDQFGLSQTTEAAVATAARIFYGTYDLGVTSLNGGATGMGTGMGMGMGTGVGAFAPGIGGMTASAGGFGIPGTGAAAAGMPTANMMAAATGGVSNGAWAGGLAPGITRGASLAGGSEIGNWAGGMVPGATGIGGGPGMMGTGVAGVEAAAGMPTASAYPATAGGSVGGRTTFASGIRNMFGMGVRPPAPTLNSLMRGAGGLNRRVTEEIEDEEEMSEGAAAGGVGAIPPGGFAGGGIGVGGIGGVGGAASPRYDPGVAAGQYGVGAPGIVGSYGGGLY